VLPELAVLAAGAAGAFPVEEFPSAAKALHDGIAVSSIAIPTTRRVISLRLCIILLLKVFCVEDFKYNSVHRRQGEPPTVLSNPSKTGIKEFAGLSKIYWCLEFLEYLEHCKHGRPDAILATNDAKVFEIKYLPPRRAGDRSFSFVSTPSWTGVINWM
jgi:hypothetical protein